MNTPMNGEAVSKIIKESKLKNVGLASIRELNRLVNNIEKATGEKFIRMEMGIPGLDAPKVAIDAEIEALKRGVSSKYPPFEGVPEVKSEIQKFVKNFMNVDVNFEGCLPTVGSMQGCYMGQMVCTRRFKNKNKILFIDPGFPVNKRQAAVIGIQSASFDIYDFRGDKLRDKLDSILSSGEFGALLYSNPNNPAWITLTEEELSIIGEMCTKHDVVALEDLAYFGMDFRLDYSKPGVEPFIPTVAKYTDNYILIISSSKSFTLAGQRIGMTVISNNLFEKEYKDLESWFGSTSFGHAYLFGALYALSSGVSHSAQYGLAGVLKAVNDGTFNFVDSVREYGERAKVMKDLFKKYGFHIVYDTDGNEPIADGFYFTVAYNGFDGGELIEELLYYGISAIALTTTGSTRHEGLRACVSLTGSDRYEDLEERLKCFAKDHENNERAKDFFRNV
ncbi:MAG: pyridoxal phosphate-dependent aminotransferase [Candidatus Delongbacteria bacterium]|nr:pyridoxal phosphate-dependent aminotransferase [Candidatus Delongbacteria bacterium]MBN2835819.1 pyridoxal phosphate-dependent aminotransferase [Candidatus Delongbacteria bacterium]